ncbi:hypothetical protein RFI_25132, partial [Reticulomyxa filosa]
VEWTVDNAGKDNKEIDESLIPYKYQLEYCEILDLGQQEYAIKFEKGKEDKRTKRKSHSLEKGKEKEKIGLRKVEAKKVAKPRNAAYDAMDDIEFEMFEKEAKEMPVHEMDVDQDDEDFVADYLEEQEEIQESEEESDNDEEIKGGNKKGKVESESESENENDEDDEKEPEEEEEDEDEDNDDDRDDAKGGKKRASSKKKITLGEDNVNADIEGQVLDGNTTTTTTVSGTVQKQMKQMLNDTKKVDRIDEGLKEQVFFFLLKNKNKNKNVCKIGLNPVDLVWKRVDDTITMKKKEISCHYKLRGLKEGVKYLVRIRGKHGSGWTEWTPPIAAHKSRSRLVLSGIGKAAVEFLAKQDRQPIFSWGIQCIKISNPTFLGFFQGPIKYKVNYAQPFLTNSNPNGIFREYGVQIKNHKKQVSVYNSNGKGKKKTFALKKEIETGDWFYFKANLQRGYAEMWHNVSYVGVIFKKVPTCIVPIIGNNKKTGEYELICANFL